MQLQAVGSGLQQGWWGLWVQGNSPPCCTLELMLTKHLLILYVCSVSRKCLSSFHLRSLAAASRASPEACIMAEAVR